MALEHIIHRLDNVAKLVRPWLPYNMDTENENEKKAMSHNNIPKEPQIKGYSNTIWLSRSISNLECDLKGTSGYPLSYLLHITIKIACPF